MNCNKLQQSLHFSNSLATLSLMFHLPHPTNKNKNRKFQYHTKSNHPQHLKKNNSNQQYLKQIKQNHSILSNNPKIPQVKTTHKPANTSFNGFEQTDKYNHYQSYQTLYPSNKVPFFNTQHKHNAQNPHNNINTTNFYTIKKQANIHSFQPQKLNSSMMYIPVSRSQSSIHKIQQFEIKQPNYSKVNQKTFFNPSNLKLKKPINKNISEFNINTIELSQKGIKTNLQKQLLYQQSSQNHKIKIKQHQQLIKQQTQKSLCKSIPKQIQQQNLYRSTILPNQNYQQTQKKQKLIHYFNQDLADSISMISKSQKAAKIITLDMKKYCR